MTSPQPAVFLDRDGVITVPIEREGKGYAPRRLDDLHIYPGVDVALTELHEAGFRLVVVTNQPDVAAGHLDPLVLAEMHRRLRRELPIQFIHTCPHLAAAGCSCRKPLPGMLLAENARTAVDMARSWMVGDRDSDIEAGRSAGCRTVFIDRGWRAESGLTADVRVGGLPEAVVAILGLADDV